MSALKSYIFGAFKSDPIGQRNPSKYLIPFPRTGVNVDSWLYM